MKFKQKKKKKAGKKIRWKKNDIKEWNWLNDAENIGGKSGGLEAEETGMNVKGMCTRERERERERESSDTKDRQETQIEKRTDTETSNGKR